MSDVQVLIAHDNPALAREIAEALQPCGAGIATVRTGTEARTRLLRDHPRVLVVDVALSERAPFELCDDIREAGLRTRVVLVASVYDRTRYKRRPTSLYGADDYVEQHHIHDLLPPKVERLLTGQPTAEPAPGGTDVATLERLRVAGTEPFTIRYGSLAEGREKTARLAELLVADVLLYNGEAVAADRPLGEVTGRLREDLEEARAILARLVPAEVRGETDWVGERLTGVLERRRAGRGDPGRERSSA